MSTSTPTREVFARWVHEVLNRLYDASYLQRHPLAEAMAGPDVSALHRSQHLRRIIHAAIHSLRAENGAPAQSPHDRRAARILPLRFIEGLTPAEAMQQLAYGRSQFFHEQARMLDLLTTICWHQYQQLAPLAVDAPYPPSGEEFDISRASREQLAHAEVERLLAHATWQPVELAQVVGQLPHVLGPVAAVKGKALVFNLDSLVELGRADRVLLRQAMLNATTFALDVVAQGQVTIATFSSANARGLHIRAQGVLHQHDSTQDIQRSGLGLEICRQLVAAMQGTCTLATNNTDTWQVTLTWRCDAPQSLLVIDDNEGFAELFRRYLTGYGWQVTGAATGTLARNSIAERRPTVIMLDVMMPSEDGWEFLIALRADTATSDLPVIVCSVLNEPRMALTLGATSYLLKPVTQQALLQSLEPWWITAASLVQGR